MIDRNIKKIQIKIMRYAMIVLAVVAGLSCSQAFPDDVLLLLLMNEAIINEPYTIFISNATYQGNLGGPSAADAHCQSDAANPDVSRFYKALLVDGVKRTACSNSNCSPAGSNDYLDWVLKANRPYYRMEAGVMTFLARTSPGRIFEFEGGTTLHAGLHSDGAREWWTGLSSSWQSDSNDCANWTDNTVGNSGIGGIGNQTNSTSIANLTVLCLSSRYLVCVQQ